MTNEEIFSIARAQSALDINCAPDDFLKSSNVVVPAVIGPHARRYYREPVACNLVSYGHNAVASVKDEYAPFVRAYIEKYSFCHCFETPNLHVLDAYFAPFGQKTCFMAEYFLPDLTKLSPLSCPYELRLIEKEELSRLYVPEWSNALSFTRPELDTLGVGAYDQGRLIALAACSADCDTMYQIGVDVLPPYRLRGVASALTSRLALEIIALGRVPFYCCAWSNIASARNAVRSGFVPAWAELTVKPAAFVDEMNG